MRPVKKWACVLGGYLVVVTAVAVARAQPQHAVVFCGDGPDSEQVISRVVSHLRAPYQRREGSEFCKSLSSSRLGTPAAAATDRKADAKLIVRVRAAARSASADLAILVSTRRPKRGAPGMHVWLVDADGDGPAEIDEEVTVGSGASTAEQGDAAWSVLASDVRMSGGETAPPGPAAPGSASTEVATTSAAPSVPADADRGASREPASEAHAGRKGDLLWIRAAIASGSRNFSYVDRMTPTLRSYALFAAPMARVDAEVYPFARTALPGGMDFGITGDYARAFAVSSDDSSGTSVSSNWSLFDVGAHERFPLGRSWLLGLGAGYGEMTFLFDGALATTAALPGVQYHLVRFGGDVRVALGSFSLYGYGSYLDVLSTGPVGAYFARATVGGLEGRLGLSHDLGHGFEVSFEVAYTRFFYAFNPQPGDAYVAGGALDQMTFASLGVGYIL